MATLTALLIAFAPIIVAVVIAKILEWLSPDAPRDTGGIRGLHSAVLYLLGNVIIFLLVPAGHLGVTAWTEIESYGLLNIMNAPTWLAILVGILAMDLGEWVSHYLMHRVPALWRLHRVHHSDQHMDIATGYRFHPIEMTLRYLAGIVVIVIVGVSPQAVAAFAFLIIAFNAWEHANVTMPRFLRPIQNVLITPELHRVHHSDRPEHFSSNFGVLTSLWDRAFGTLTLFPEDADLRYGLGSDSAASRHGTLTGLLFQPFEFTTSGRKKAGETNSSVDRNDTRGVP